MLTCSASLFVKETDSKGFIDIFPVLQLEEIKCFCQARRIIERASNKEQAK